MLVIESGFREEIGDRLPPLPPFAERVAAQTGVFAMREGATFQGDPNLTVPEGRLGGNI